MLRKKDKTKTQTEWKRSLRDYARLLFPNVEGITLKTCDALLILKAGLDKHYEIKS